MSEAAARRLYCSRCLNTFEADHEQCPNLSCRRKRPTRGWGVIFAEGDIFDRNYRIHKMLAVGGAGVTYLGREIDANGEETGPRLAIKVLLAARDAGPYVRRLATEAQIIQELDHANIVQYLGFVHRAGHSPFLLTRFESGGSLLDHMRRVGTLSVRAACVVGRQICWALEKAHERGIVHRDLKPENVLLSRTVPAGEDPVVRVADFGIAKVQGSLNTNLTRVGAFVGTPHYAAPEQFVGGTVTEAADVYSVGALLYFCMTARHVARFADRLDPEEGFQLLCDSLPPLLERTGEDPATLTRMNAVLAVAMRVDPKQRCTVVELDRMLEAVAAGRDPEPPVQPALAPEVALAPAAVGLLPPPAPLAAGAAPPPGAGVPAALTRSEPTMAGGEVGAGQVQPVAAPVPVPAPAAPPAGAPPPASPLPAPAPVAATAPSVAPPVSAAAPPARAPRAPVAPARRGGLGCVAGLFVLGLGLIALLVAIGLGIWVARPELLGLEPGAGPFALPTTGPAPAPAPSSAPAPAPSAGPGAELAAPVEISESGPDRGSQREHQRIAKDLQSRKGWLVERCGAPPAPVTVQITLVIEADGRTRSAEVSGADATLRACLEPALRKLTHKRGLQKPVRLQLPMTLP